MSTKAGQFIKLYKIMYAKYAKQYNLICTGNTVQHLWWGSFEKTVNS